MNSKIKEIEILSILIEKHIKTLKEEELSKEEKEVEYIFLEETIKMIVEDHKKAKGICIRAGIMKSILKIYNDLYGYLIAINRFDHRILALYDLLDKEIYRH